MNVPTDSAQAAVCARFGAVPLLPGGSMKVGISQNARDGSLPVNGLRHAPAGRTTGWYIWAGEELSDDADFFQPLHVQHLMALCPLVVPYLALPPGWRFLLADGHEDVWFDPAIINHEPVGEPNVKNGRWMPRGGGEP